MNEYFADWRRDAASWLRERGLEIWIITGIWALLTLVIYLLATGHESPRRYQDEFLFWALAKNFAHGDGLTWRGVGLGMKSWLYPVLLAPAFWVADGVPGQYTLVHLINSMMICGAIFPAYLMARLMVDRWRALIAALMVVAVPAMNYAGVIGTENLGYPLFVAACGGMLLALARPRPRNALLAFALVLCAILSRTQFVILLPVFTGALLLCALMARPGGKVQYLRERSSVWIGLVVAALLGGAMLLTQGKGAFGLYAGAFDGLHLTTENLWFWLKAFSADIYLLTAIVPAIATLAMFGRAENRRDPVIGALLAITLVASLAMLAQVSWFSAVNPYDWRGRHIFYERYMFYLGPLFLVGLIASYKRVTWTSAVVSAAFATVVVSGFQTDAVLIPFSYDSFGLSLIGRHMQLHPNAAEQIGMLLARVTLLLGVVYVISTVVRSGLARRILYWGLVAFVFTALIATQAQTWHYARQFSKEAFSAFPKPANFIDKNTDQPVGMVITSTDDPLSYFTTEFWNARVDRVFSTSVPPIITPVMYSPKCQFDWSKTGAIESPGCEPVPNAWYLRSDNVVMHLRDEYLRVHPSGSWPTVTLMAGRAPVRILSLTAGRQVRTGLIQSGMNIRTFLDAPGQIRLRLRTAAGVTAVVALGNRSVLVSGQRASTLTVDLPPNEWVGALTVRGVGGEAGSVAAPTVELREGEGRWRSIL